MQPTLTSERLVLTPLADEHLPLEYDLDTNTEVMQYLGGPAPDRAAVERSHARRTALGRRREGLGFWVAHAGELFVGLLMLPPAHGPDQPDDPGVADLGYRLHPAAWGHGYGREAATALLAHAFDTVGVLRVIAQTRSDNHRSRGLLEDVGMSFVREFRSLDAPSDGPPDSEYAIDRDHWHVLSAARVADARVAVRRPTIHDVPSWLSLAREVEPLFGPMPGLADAIERGIGRGTALVTGPVGAITGGMLLSRDDQPHRIHWLAVSEVARGHGLGGSLVRAALERWPEGDVEVVTFTDGVPGAMPARRLYERCGMECTGPADPAPDGGARDRYLLRR